MHIVWLILKILLIVILSLVGLVLLLALLILFAPVRYKAYIRKQDDIWAKLTARWLGFVLCFKLVYDQESGINYRLRLFGGTLFGSDSPAKNKTSDSNTDEISDNSTDSTSTEYQERDKHKDNDNDNEDVSGETDFADSFPSADSADRDFLLEDHEFESGNGGKGRFKDGFFTRIGKKIDSICKKIITACRNASEKLKGLKKKKDGYTKLMNNVRTKEAIRVVKVQLIALLKALKPSKLKGQVTYGTGDPATTGQQLGYMSVLFPLYYDHIDITPDFENKRLEGDLMVKGSIRLWSVGWCVLKVIWNKNVKITVSRFKKITGGN